MQECNKYDPPIEGPAYCATLTPASEPSVVARACLGLHFFPELTLPEPPLGGAVCIDFDSDDKPPEKVFND